MPIGCVLLSIKKQVQDQKGDELEGYPEKFHLSLSLKKKLIQLISTNKPSETTILELSYHSRPIFLARKIISDHEDVYVILLLSNDEQEIKFDFLQVFQEHAPAFLQLPIEQMRTQFSMFASTFFQPKKMKKLLFIGFPEAGKTSIKKTFFDGEDPSLILSEQAPAPTFGLAHYVYSWLDAEIGIVDTSGQEFTRYVQEKPDIDDQLAFESSDVIIYVFDIPTWEDNPKLVLENLNKVINAQEKNAPEAKIYAFCHKIDLVQQTKFEKAKYFLNIKETIQNQFGIKTIFTSIRPDLSHTLFRSMQIILNELSQVGLSLDEFTHKIIEGKEFAAIYLLDQKNDIVAQAQTENFIIENLSELIKSATKWKQIFKESSVLGDVDYSVTHTHQGYSVLVKTTNILKYHISTLIYIDKGITKNQMNQLLVELKRSLQILR